VGDQAEAHLVVADVDVGVVVGGLGDGRDFVDERDGGDEVREGVVADELAVFELPAGQSVQCGFEFGVCEFWHGVPRVLKLE